MMNSPRSRHTEVVIGGNHIHHIQVGAHLHSQVHGTTYHSHHMFHVVSLVELCIPWQNLTFHKLHQVEASCPIHIFTFI